MCMKNGRIFLFRFGEYLACLDAASGSELWRKTPENALELFASLGKYLTRQSWQTNWRTTDRDRREPRGSLPPTPPGIRVTYHGGSTELSVGRRRYSGKVDRVEIAISQCLVNRRVP